jgi:hypothetical protein
MDQPDAVATTISKILAALKEPTQKLISIELPETSRSTIGLIQKLLNEKGHISFVALSTGSTKETIYIDTNKRLGKKANALA